MSLTWLVFLTTLAAFQVEAEALYKFTVYSNPVRLRYGQVFRAFIKGKIPEDVVSRYADGTKIMAVARSSIALVRFDKNGREVPVSLHDHYLHHALAWIGHSETDPPKPVLQSQLLQGRPQTIAGVSVRAIADNGSECRGPMLDLESPFRILIAHPEVMAFRLHIINTNKADRAAARSPLIECPCAPPGKLAPDAMPKAAEGALDCHQKLARGQQASTPCDWSTYLGGALCCHHMGFLIDTAEECSDKNCTSEPTDVVYAKLVAYYEDAEPETRDMEWASCCDVTTTPSKGAVSEFDIPKCADGTTDEECIFVLEAVQPLCNVGRFGKASDLVDIASARPHVHFNALSLQLIDDVTGEVLCEAHNTERGDGSIRHGRGTSPGDELGLVVGLEQCSWSGKNARRYRRDHPMRSRVVYNASQRQFGAMGIWKVMVANVKPD